LEFEFVRFELEKHDPLVASITDLLHRSYAPLAAAGMRYLATHQGPEITRSRLLEGESFLTYLGGELIGTITLKPTKAKSRSKWYCTEGVFHFSQFAVDPRFQGLGIGSRVMDRIEARAKELGAVELALDTSERAGHLIETYTRRGYRFIEYVQWEETNYRSVILSKQLN
jgi:GNAT superfamily N-acetyltransferase